MTNVPADARGHSRLSTARQAITGRVDSGPVLTIAAGAFMASLSMNFWIPFLPFYMLQLGATSDAGALFWVGIATGGQGIARMVAGPFWGMLSDRLGRKPMYIRTLYFATATTLIAAVATQPWHLAIAFACQGLFSGFIPAAVALTSVTVPESKLSSSLGTVTAAQYLGSTVGPAVGAVLAIGFGMRGAILASALLPALAATMVLFVVPRDTVVRSTTAKPRESTGTAAQEATRDKRRFLSFQFGIAILICFVLFATGQMVRLMAPVSIAGFTGESATGIVGIAFTVAGVASVLGVVVARRVVRPRRFARLIAGGMAATAVAHVLIAVAPNAVVYVAFFALVSLLQAALLPASNTLIAVNAPRDRRGTAFGIASSAQALAFLAGPMSAAMFAAVSLSFGYIVLAVLFVCVAAFTLLAMRVPPMH